MIRYITIITLCSFLTACGGGPANFGDELSASASIYEQASEKWREGQDMIATGYESIQDGQDAVNEGNQMVHDGHNMMRLGEQNVNNGRATVYQVEQFFRQNGMGQFAPQQQGNATQPQQQQANPAQGYGFH